MDAQTITQIHFFTSTLSLLVPLGVGIWLFKRLDRSMKILFIYILSGFAVELIGLVLTYMVANNSLIYQAFVLLEYPLLMLVFYQWQDNVHLKRVMFWSIPVFLFTWLMAKLIVFPNAPIDSVSLPVESIVFVALSVMTLMDVNRESLGNLFSRSEFWFSAALLIYFAGNLMLFLLMPKFSSDVQMKIYFVHSFLNLIYNLFYAKAFLCQKDSPISASP